MVVGEVGEEWRWGKVHKFTHKAESERHGHVGGVAHSWIIWPFLTNFQLDISHAWKRPPCRSEAIKLAWVAKTKSTSQTFLFVCITADFNAYQLNMTELDVLLLHDVIVARFKKGCITSWIKRWRKYQRNVELGLKRYKVNTPMTGHAPRTAQQPDTFLPPEIHPCE
jgi:hypothetical protein